MSPIRVGVIGAGSWAVASHLPNLAKHDDVEFVGVSRKGPELLEKIKNEYGFQVASEDYRDILDAGLDVAIVASPSGFHAEHALAALETVLAAARGDDYVNQSPAELGAREVEALDIAYRSAASRQLERHAE